MADLLNTNTGPERVEVIPVPTGVVPVPGASTAITAFIISSTKDGAPVDTAVEIASLEDFVDQFGDETECGLSYFAIRGFYANAGAGSPALIINVNPSASGATVSDFGVADTAGGGFVEEYGIMLSGLSISGYALSSGILSFSGSPDLSGIKQGDYLKDDNGRLFIISAIDVPGFTVTILPGLNTSASVVIHSENGLKLTSTAAKILRLYEADEHNKKALVQEGASKGVVTISSATSTTANVSAGGLLNIGAKKGDILVDSASAVFYITELVDDDQATLDRSGVALGVATIKAGVVATIQDTKRSASANASVTQPVVAFSSAAAGYGILPVSYGTQPVNALKDHFCTIGGQEKELLSSTIIASGTLDANFGVSPTFAYTSASGLVQFSAAVNLSTVVVGDVFRDASANDFIIDAVNDGADNITIAKGKTVNNAALSTIRRGQLKVFFKDTAFNPGIVSVPNFFEPAATLELLASVTGLADDYFIADAIVQDSDYIGTQADGRGIHALDVIDDVNLVCIPNVTARAIQNALIDYCEVERNDCFALLMIPRSITQSNLDKVKLNVVISSIVNGASVSTLTLSASPNLSAVNVGDVLEYSSVKYIISDVDVDSFKITVESASITGSGAAVISAPSAVTYKEVIVNNPSKNAAWYYNHAVVQRSEDSTNVVVDPIGHVAGVIARIDANIAVGGVSHAPAGIQFAGLADTVGLDLTLNEKNDGGPLRLSFINRITQSSGAGRYVFGGYTADSGTTPLFTAEEQLMQVIRANMFIKKSLERGLKRFIWENFSPVTQFQAHKAIETFLQNNSYLFPAGLRQSEQFNVISVAATVNAIAKGLMKFRVQVRTNSAVKFLEIALEFPLPQSNG